MPVKNEDEVNALTERYKEGNRNARLQGRRRSRVGGALAARGVPQTIQGNAVIPREVVTPEAQPKYESAKKFEEIVDKGDFVKYASLDEGRTEDLRFLLYMDIKEWICCQVVLPNDIF